MESLDEKKYDFLIVGAGVAGMAAAIYGARAGLKTLVLDTGSGGQTMQIDLLENYPGAFPAVSGAAMSDTMRAQAESFGAEFKIAKVSGIDKIKNAFSVTTKKDTYESTALLIATGADHNHLGIKGESEFAGRGVSYCAVCDGAFFKGKNVVVVGGGDSAVSEALYLTKIAAHVTIVLRRDKFRAQATLVSRLLSKENVSVRYNAAVSEICGEGKVQSVKLASTSGGDVATGGVAGGDASAGGVASAGTSAGSEVGASEIPCDAIFILVGMSPVTELVATLPHEKNGALITNERMETSVPGLYAAGDVRAKPFRQVVTAAADGAVAALAAAEYVDEQRAISSGSGVSK